MACTPHKTVQWSDDNKVKEFVYGSPYSEASSSDSINATSTLHYINSQLLAHGFARGSGISFEGLSKEDSDNLSKCMLGMLNQRNEDMSRAEDLSTKLRTLSYEHERLAGMHRTTCEQLAAAERETNLFKSRLAASNKSLQASEAAHKTTSAELQRARSAMHSVRQTHTAELKRREKETEKMIDRWQKIADAQTKLGSTASGIRFKMTLANPVVANRDNDVIGKGPDLVEDALDEAQAARKELVEENTSLKNVVLSAANELSRICYAIRARMGDVQEEAPRFSLSDMFSVSTPESVTESFATLLTSLQELVSRHGINYERDSTTPSGLPSSRPGSQATQSVIDGSRGDSKEILRLQNTIVDLRRQLEQAQTQKQTGIYADEAQAIIRRFVNEEDERGSVRERQLLEKIRKELDNARRKVDEAALTLKDEKASFEEEKQAFHREQRLWRSQMAMPHDDDEAPKSITGLGAYFDAPAEPLELPVSPLRPLRKSKKDQSPKKKAASPRKPPAASRSPARSVFAVGKVAKKMRHGGSPGRPTGSMLGASTSRPKVIPPMETEVMPLAPALPASTSTGSLIAPNTFVLPPPSPYASIPPHQTDLISGKQLAAPSFGNKRQETDGPLTLDDTDSNSTRQAQKKPFPVAKPHAEHMHHAYSPARPSPLSRILMLANSPAQSVSAPPDEDFNAEAAEVVYGTGRAGDMMLEEELGIEDASATEESPLRAKNARMASKNKNVHRTSMGVKSKARLKSSTLRGSVKTAGRETEKENGATKLTKSRSQVPPFTTKQATTVKPLLSGKGGARRVPIGSVDAAPIGPGWK